MTDKLDEVWTSRDYPVLCEVARRVDHGEVSIPAATVGQALGLDEATVGLAYDALSRRGLLVGSGSAEFRSLMWADNVTGDAYLLTGLHPSGDDAVSAFVSALRQAADLTDDPDEKNRLRAFADGALGVSRNVLIGVLTAYVAHQAGA